MKARLLALLITIPLLVACAGSKEETPQPTSRPVPTLESGRVTITFACRDSQQEYFRSLAARFEEVNSSVHIQLIPAEEAAGVQRQGNTTTSSGNPFENLAAAADTFIWSSRFRPGDGVYLLDLQAFVADPSFPTDDFFPGTLDRFRWQGGLRGLPAMLSPLVFFYNRGVFDEAGLPYPDIGWTWDDFAAAAAQLTKREGDRVERYGFADMYFDQTIIAMMQQQGVSLWDTQADPPQPLFDSPAVASTLQRYFDMARIDQVMPLPEIGTLAAFDLINQGQAAMWTDFASERGSYSRRLPIGVAPFPEGIEAANPCLIDGFFISAGTAHPEAAWRWLSYLSANYQPTYEGCLSGRRSVAEQLPWWRQLDQETRAVYEYVLAHPTTNENPLNRAPLVMAEALVLLEETSVEEALARAQTWAYKLQFQLAELTPPTPRPVATPVPEPGEGQTTMTFSPAAGEDLALYRSLAATFQESNPDLVIQVVPFSFTSMGELAATRDCFGWNGSLAIFPEGRQNLLALGPLLDTDSSFQLSDYYPQLLELLQQEGELWGLPYTADALMVYLNEDRFTAAGLALPSTRWTMQEFLNDAVTLCGVQQYGFATSQGVYGDLVFVLQRLGARLYDDSGAALQPTLDDPTVAAALEQYAGLWHSHPLSPATPSRETGWPDNLMPRGHPAGVEAGQVAMWVDTIKNHTTSPPLSFAVQVAPLPVGTSASTEFVPRAYYISAQTASPQACWKWLAFLSSRPEVVKLLPVRRSMADSAIWQALAGEEVLPAYQITLEYADTPILRLGRDVPWLAYSYPWLEEAFQAVVGGQEAATALTETQHKAEALLECLEAAGDVYDREQAKACARQVDPGYPLR